jgi:ribonuclease PH
MRKLLSALLVMFLMAGLVIATEVTVTKYDPDKKELTVKDGDKEVTYKFSDKVKVSKTDKDGNVSEDTFENLEKRLKAIKPDSKRAVKIDITVDKETITEVKYKGGKGKN